MAVATAKRGTPTEAPFRDVTIVEPVVVETPEGPVRPWKVQQPDGSWEIVEFSLREIPVAERRVYWYPMGAGVVMKWKVQETNEHGHRPTMQQECWIDGKFAPRNEWEEHMTREFLLTVPGGADLDKWIGYNHPENEPGQPPHNWRCQCGWLCGNWHAFQKHQGYLGHERSRSE